LAQPVCSRKITSRKSKFIILRDFQRWNFSHPFKNTPKACAQYGLILPMLDCLFNQILCTRYIVLCANDHYLNVYVPNLSFGAMYSINFRSFLTLVICTKSIICVFYLLSLCKRFHFSWSYQKEIYFHSQ